MCHSSSSRTALVFPTFGSQAWRACVHGIAGGRLLALLLTLAVLCPPWSHAGPPFEEFADPNPSAGNEFGHNVVALSTGNVVISAPFDDAGGTDAGAIYLFNGATGALISTLKGSTANDQVGNLGIVPLSNGNFVVRSTLWDSGAVANVGAVTWGSGTTGVSGVVSASNSLVGSTANDQVGFNGVTELTNGNYVVVSASWENGAAVDAGAVTWGSGTTGVSGVVSASNSLVGSTRNDLLGSGGVTALSNGNYVVTSFLWSNGTADDAGAVTWGSGTTGVKGVVSASNSLAGLRIYDMVGFGGVKALSNGNYVVMSPYCDNGFVDSTGAVTWGSGTAGVKGWAGSDNSLVGTTTGDQVGSSVVTLSNGNYVVGSPNWDNGAVFNAGAVTWCSGMTGVIGVVSTSNSLVGITNLDQVGNGGVTALSNGNYVVASSLWDNGAVANAGAVTWGSGTAGVSGAVSTSNSLFGSKANDEVGGGSVVALSNGSYVVRSPNWDHGAATNAGAATWGSGTTALTGAVSDSNSLVGSTANDQVGSGGVTALSNDNYVVVSPNWDNGAATNAGAVTWGNGTAGVTGVVSNSNSLVGSWNNDQVGNPGVTALSYGNYVVRSQNWDSGSVPDVGAVTWGRGTTGVSGTVNSSNSLVGFTASDQVGSGSVVGLSNGNYVVTSPLFNDNTIVDAGAVTWCSGATGMTGWVRFNNSLVGSTANDQVGSGGVTALSNGNYVVVSSNWDNGAATNAGAVTWGNGTVGVKRAVNTSNSLIGLTSTAGLEAVGLDNVNSTYFGRFLTEGSGKVRLGSQVNGPPGAPVVPTLTTPTSASITGNAATLGGNATADGGAAITERGVVYALTTTNSHPLIGGTGVLKVTSSGTTGVFTASVTGLIPGRVYSYNAYATNSVGTAYTTPTSTFTTLSNNANLSALSLSNGTLTPVFASATLIYASEVPRTVTSLTATPTAAQANATLAARVNGDPFTAVTSASASAPLALNVGNNTVDVRVTAQDGVTQKTYTVTVRRLTYLEAWRRTHYSTIDNTGSALNTAVPQHDGMANLMKFALGLNPAVSQVQPIGIAKNGGTLEFTYPRSLEAAVECTFVVEWSDTLMNDWSSTGVTEQVLSTAGLLQQVKASVDVSGTDCRFMRLRVTTP